MIYVAYGANLPGKYGRPHETYLAARQALEDNGILIVAESSLWETSPVGTPDEQPWYTNAVMEVATELPAPALLEALLAIEHDFGRVRTFKNAAKTIDLDLVAYKDQCIENGPNLIVPHPRMHERAFVLMPLQEIAPNWTHPLTAKPLSDLIKVIPTDQQFRILEPESAAS